MPEFIYAPITTVSRTKLDKLYFLISDSEPTVYQVSRQVFFYLYALFSAIKIDSVLFRPDDRQVFVDSSLRISGGNTIQIRIYLTIPRYLNFIPLIVLGTTIFTPQLLLDSFLRATNWPLYPQLPISWVNSERLLIGFLTASYIPHAHLGLPIPNIYHRRVLSLSNGRFIRTNTAQECIARLHMSSNRKEFLLNLTILLLASIPANLAICIGGRQYEYQSKCSCSATHTPCRHMAAYVWSNNA